MKKIDSKGFTTLETILVLIVLVGVGGIGWFVYKNGTAKPETSTTKTQTTQTTSEVTVTPEQVPHPESWVQFKDNSTGVTFYHPAEFDTSEIKVQKASVSETIKGVHFGPYSENVTFDVTKNVWQRTYQDDGKTYTVETGVSSTPATASKNYPALYGVVGEGGGAGHFMAFTDKSSSYLIDLPHYTSHEDPGSVGFERQKAAIVDMLKTIRIN